MRARPPSNVGPVELSQLLLVSLVLVALVFSSPLVPGLSIARSGPPDAVSAGNATVSSVTVESGSVRITPGRFGTEIAYLRAPDATVRLATVEGSPRIVYRLQVPALNIDHVATRLLSEPGAVTVRMTDVGIRPQQLSADSYQGRLTVRVQSTTLDRVVRNESVTIEVRQ